jgi:hypothetical protein
MEGENNGFDKVLELLPAGWEEKAKELKALVRARGIKTPEELLRLILVYLTEGKSFAGTSAVINMGGGGALNKNAAYSRIRNSAEWLEWLCVNLLRQGGCMAEKPRWLEGKDVYLIDGSEVVYGGSKKNYSMLHYCLDAYTLSMKEMHLTGGHEGEKLARFELPGPGVIVLADRMYGNIPGMEHLRERGSGFVLRLRGRAFTVYDGAGRKIELLDRFRGLKEGESGSARVYYRVNGQDIPVRVCALRKDQESERAGLKRLTKTKQRKRRGGPVSDVQRAYNKYIVVATSLDEGVPAERVLELYRVRWQIELAFKRLKSLFQYNEIPVKLERSARAWFYGKLLLAALCETLVNTGRFSPWGGGGNGGGGGAAQPVEGTAGNPDVCRAPDT